MHAHITPSFENEVDEVDESTSPRCRVAICSSTFRKTAEVDEVDEIFSEGVSCSFLVVIWCSRSAHTHRADEPVTLDEERGSG